MKLLKALAGLGATALGVAYLLNLGGGLIELIPDAMPFVGNLDEAAAVGLVIWGVKRLRALKRSKLPVGGTPEALPTPDAAAQL